MRGLYLLAAFAAILPGCGSQRLVYITEIYPYSDVFPTVVHGTSGGWSISGGTPSVDTGSGFCYCATEKVCVNEMMTSHGALIFIKNDYPADAGNPLAGRVSINSYQLSLSPVTDGAPDLQDSSGGIKLDLDADSEAYVSVPLASLQAKVEFARARLSVPVEYVVSYRLKGAPDLELTGTTTVEFGDFVNCAEGCTPVSDCAVVPTN